MKTTLFSVILLVSVTITAQAQLTSSNLPIFVIDTQGETIVDEPKILSTLGIIDNGEGNMNNITDPFNDYDGNIGIEIRGSSSQSFPKKSFGFETRDSENEDESVSLLGMPEEEDWILYAPYSDKSLIRNAFTFLTAGSLQSIYASRIRLCELVINDEYQGVYVLMEKIKRDKERVDIAKLKDDEVSGEDLTGGYIVKIDKDTGSGGAGFTSQFTPDNRSEQQTIFFQYEYPDADDIVSEQMTYIQSFIGDFEQALMSGTFDDAETGYPSFINTPSFIDYFIMNELTKNVDGYRLSAYMYKDKDDDGGKLNAGPIWDYNLALGNADYCEGGDWSGWGYQFNEVCPADFWLIPFWWERLLEDPNFVIALKQRWQALRTNELSNTTLLGRVDDLTNDLSDAQTRNFEKWDILGEYVWPNNFVGGNYPAEVDYLKDWLTQRLTWIDSRLDGDDGVITSVDSDISESTWTFFPNPFNHSITFRFRDDSARILVVHNLQGEEVARINTQSSSFVWDGSGEHGSTLSAGAYIVAVQGEAGSARLIVKK